MLPGARAALVPLVSSPARLSVSAAFVIAAAFLAQFGSGVPAWGAFAPIELSSNVIACMGAVWAAIELHARRADEARRAPWAAALLAMLLLAVDGAAPDPFFAPYGLREMQVSIVLWGCAAALLFFAVRRLSPSGAAVAVQGVGVGAQALAQYAGWLGMSALLPAARVETLEYLNDFGELASVLAYLSALLLIEFAPREASAAPQPRRSAEIIDLIAHLGRRERAPHVAAFPALYRVTGHAWRSADGAEPERFLRSAYVFRPDDSAGLEEPVWTRVEQPDRDDEWIVVRLHRRRAEAEAYARACADLSDHAGPPLQTRQGWVTVVRRKAAAGGPDKALVYATPDAGGRGWTLAIGPDGRPFPAGGLGLPNDDAEWVD